MPHEELDLSECRSLQLAILAAFDSHCADQGLTYYLAYGTLLGAVRHGGYIPWDDDIDVMMPRDDYERLRESTRAIGDFALRGGTDESGWPYPFLKVSDRGSRVEEGSRVDADLGVNIDVFPVDGLPAGRCGRNAQSALINALTAVLSLQGMAPRPGRAPAKRLIAAATIPLLSVVPRSLLLRFLDRAARRRTRGSHSGVFVGSYQWSAPDEAFGTPSTESFEGTPRHVPADPHTVLTQMYGADHMQLPPVEQRVTHHTFRAFRR